MKVIRRVGGTIVVGYLTVLEIVACISVGFALGSINTYDMAKDSISQFERATNAAIMLRYGHDL